AIATGDWHDHPDPHGRLRPLDDGISRALKLIGDRLTAQFGDRVDVNRRAFDQAMLIITIYGRAFALALIDGDARGVPGSRSNRPLSSRNINRLPSAE